MARPPHSSYGVINGKKLFNRQCENCCRWYRTTRPYTISLCNDCREFKSKRSSDAEFNRIPQGAYIVVSCPDPFGYPKGAVFDKTQWKAMKIFGGLIPGMVVIHNGITIEIDPLYRERRV